jgi:hypothetical protein
MEDQRAENDPKIRRRKIYKRPTAFYRALSTRSTKSSFKYKGNRGSHDKKINWSTPAQGQVKPLDQLCKANLLSEKPEVHELLKERSSTIKMQESFLRKLAAKENQVKGLGLQPKPGEDKSPDGRFQGSAGLDSETDFERSRGEAEDALMILHSSR